MADNPQRQNNENDARHDAQRPHEYAAIERDATLSSQNVKAKPENAASKSKFAPFQGWLFVMRVKWRRWRWKRRKREKARLTDTFITAATIVIAIAAIFQWSEMRDAGTQTDKIICAAQKIEADLNAANSQNLQALRQTLSQSQTSLKTTVDQFHLDQRPWVGFEQVSYRVNKSASGESLAATFVIRNSGKTPALHVRSGFIAFQLAGDTRTPTYEQEIEDVQNGWKMRTKRFIQMGRKAGMPEKIISERIKNMGSPMSEQELFPSNDAIAPQATRSGTAATSAVLSLRENHMYEYVLVHISYEDAITKGKHTTDLCVRYTGYVTGFCPTGNSMN